MSEQEFISSASSRQQITNGYPGRITAIVAGFLDEGSRIQQIDAIAYKPAER